MAPCLRHKARRKTTAILLAVSALLTGQGQAATYFISQTQGNDANAGTSSGTPWRHLSRLDSVALQPGDQVLLKRGDAWRETLGIRNSGTLIQPIVFGSYGTGEPPLLLGTERYTEISSPGNSRHEVFTGDPAEVFVLNGVPGTRRSADNELLNEGDWFWSGGVLRFRAVAKPAAVEAGTRQFGIVFAEVRHVQLSGYDIRWTYDPVWLFSTTSVTIENLRITEGAGFAGVFVAADNPAFGSGNVVRGCTIERQGPSVASASFGNFGTGIFVFGTGSSDENLIENNIVRDLPHEGIGIIDGARNTIRGNVVSGCGSSGIRLAKEGCVGNIIEYNESFGNCRLQDDRFGIDLLITGDDNVVRYNYVHDQEEAPGGPFKSGGIRFDGGDFSDSENQTSTGNIAYYNVVVDEYVGINVFNASNIRVFNNTVVDCTGFGIVVHAVSTQVPTGNSVINNLISMPSEVPLYINAVANTTVDHNLYDSNEQIYFFANGVIHNFDTWRSVAAFDAHGLFTPAQLADLGALDLRPKVLSPAIDAGRNLGLDSDFSGRPVPSGSGVDIGAYEFVPDILPEGEGQPEGEGAPEGQPDGEGMVEGEGQSEGEGMPAEGEGQPEGESPVHSADINGDHIIQLSELLRVVQLFRFGPLHCDAAGEDGYAPGGGSQACPPHSADFDPQDWAIQLAELLRVIQFYNADGYTAAPTADGFAPAV
ncbi:MAG: hypothetical protein GC168_02465 [Candidatus Hydrogenedens sp.]|nr:hypothetical protein [Candidatus Hydrogenedens sp.]